MFRAHFSARASISALYAASLTFELFPRTALLQLWRRQEILSALKFDLLDHPPRLSISIRRCVE